jgi:phosphonate ABC transporter permease subunit PhnE
MDQELVKRTTRNVAVTIGIIVAIVLVYALTIQQTEISLAKAMEPGRQQNLIRVLRLLANPDIFAVDPTSGSLELSHTAQITLERIIETILMALVASTVGTALAVPFSFLAARNLMEDITSPLASVMGGLVALPVGGFVGWLLASTLSGWARSAIGLPNGTVISLGVLAGPAAAVWVINRFAPPLVSIKKRSRGVELQATLAIVLSILLGILSLAALAQLGLELGAWLRRALAVSTILGIDFFGFFGNFIYVISDIVALFLPLVTALLAGLVAASYGSRLGQQAVISWKPAPSRVLTTVLTLLGTSILVVAVTGFVGWLKQFDVPPEWSRWIAISGGTVAAMLAAAAWPFRPHSNRLIRLGFSVAALVGSGLIAGVAIFAVGRLLAPLYDEESVLFYVGLMSLVGGVPAALLALATRPNHPFSIGFVLYTISRGLLNVTRSIEPLIMGIVFVVWVSLGPFAGIMALTLHSIAALGKLFSEQVEGILEGPVEAITATGAGRLQTIVYAVIPQIIPPYIAFALYRWDINVRMSTIIGFVGGGGIGFVLSQNIQQLRYRQASVMMLAIAIVVAVLDYASAKIRSRII